MTFSESARPSLRGEFRDPEKKADPTFRAADTRIVSGARASGLVPPESRPKKQENYGLVESLGSPRSVQFDVM